MYDQRRSFMVRLIAGIAPFVIACGGAASGQAVAALKFEVASIRPCKPGDSRPAGRSMDPNASGTPGSLKTGCELLKSIIAEAYGGYANGHINPPPLPPIEGGPSWINAAYYDINAKTEVGAPSGGMMKGPMMQALLEDRFKLRIRRETREGPAYALRVAKSGPKLKPFQPGSCLDIGLVTPLATSAPRSEPGKRPVLCGVNSGLRNGLNQTWDLRGVNLEFFAKVFLGGTLDRPVFNETGIEGLFDVHLEFMRDEPTLGAEPADPDGPSIFTAIQGQLGLKLEPAQGPREFLVIDKVERPSEN
jgi:uncharacterized protein (TIGR03435 family)